MAYTFKITFPPDQHVTLTAATKTESDQFEGALVALGANYVVKGPNWIGGSFRMTPKAWEVFDRLAPSQPKAAVPSHAVPGKSTSQRIVGIAGMEDEAIA